MEIIYFPLFQQVVKPDFRRMFPFCGWMVITAPLRLHRSCMFSNQVACFHSDLCPEDVRIRLKNIEREAGRCPEDKPLEVVKLDVDLLMCEDCVLKPEDWKRAYVQCGLKYLNIL